MVWKKKNVQSQVPSPAKTLGMQRPPQPSAPPSFEAPNMSAAPMK